MWEYPCRDFPLPVQSAGDEWSYGAWGCCAACKLLVDQKAWYELLERIMPDEEPGVVTYRAALAVTYRAALVVLWRRFDASREGEAQPWG